MKIGESLKYIHENNDLVIHKLFPEGTKMLGSDWIRVYISDNYGNISKSKYSCSYQDRDKIPNDILNLECLEQTTWIIGGILSLDFIIGRSEDDGEISEETCNC